MKAEPQTSTALGESADIEETVSLMGEALAAPAEALTIAQYQRLAATTDRTANAPNAGLDFPFLGLFGEAGSLLSELKKKQRDADSYVGYESSVVEELGDVLWYFAALASRAKIDLSQLAHDLNRSEKTIPAEITFSQLQSTASNDGRGHQADFEQTLIRLAGETGKLATDFSDGAISSDSELALRHLTPIFIALIDASCDAEVSLAQAAHGNLAKIFDRWPPKRVYPPLFDAGDVPEEQLPRRIEMHIFEREVNDQTYVFLRCKGINIGDRLTDNKLEKDDYRFHDVFHLAYAAILGWSPVMRSLFRVKRKSKPEIDEAEDGARAKLIEEGVSTWIFNYAEKLNFFETVKSVDYGLLKAVRTLVTGYEAERRPLWMWEEAILKGYEMFRAMRKHRRGVVIADLDERSISFEEMDE